MALRFPVIPVILLTLFSAGCSKSEEQQRPPAGKHALEAVNSLMGEALFFERCRDCHTVQGKGGVVGADLSTIGAKRSRAYLEQVIREPSKVFPGSAMPPYDTLSAQQIDSLVDYLGKLK